MRRLSLLRAGLPLAVVVWLAALVAPAGTAVANTPLPPDVSPNPGSTAQTQSPEVSTHRHVPGHAGSGGSQTPVHRALTPEERNLQTIYGALCETYDGVAELPFCQASPGAPAVTPDPGRDIALALRAQLTITMPALHTAPPPGTPAVTGYPLWLWVDRAAVHPVTKSVTFGPLQVSITATPHGVDWAMGDGHSVHCDDAGTPFVQGVTDPASTPTCSYAYAQRSTTTDPNGTYTLRGSMTWQITWRANTGEGGTLDPLTVTASIPVQVHDLQAVLD